MNPVSIGRHMVAHRLPEGAWRVFTRKGAVLGTIEWHAEWRQFEFAPQFGTAYTHDCLAAMGKFLQEQNVAAKATGGAR